MREFPGWAVFRGYLSAGSCRVATTDYQGIYSPVDPGHGGMLCGRIGTLSGGTVRAVLKSWAR